jgi:mRNA interferase HigB
LLAIFTTLGPKSGCPGGDVKADFGNASILKEGRVVFNIAGNKYRLVTSINYPYGIVYVKFVGTHKQYDAIDAQSI